MTTQNNDMSGTKRFTIGQRWFHRGTPPMATYGNYKVAFPYLRISGKWLQEWGFCIGQEVDVRYEMGKLIISLAEEDDDGWVK